MSVKDRKGREGSKARTLCFTRLARDDVHLPVSLPGLFGRYGLALISRTVPTAEGFLREGRCG